MPSTNAEKFKAVLLDMYQPGAITRDPDSLHGHCVEEDANALARFKDAVDQLNEEIFPYTATDCLEEWETAFDVIPPPGATVAERQAVLLSRWRGAMPSNNAGIRAILAPLLNSEYQFRDRCDDNNVSARYEEITGGGEADEDANRLRVRIPAGNDGRWDATNKNFHARLLDIIDREDDYYLEVQYVTSISVGLGSAAGSVLYQDEENALIFAPWNVGSTTKLRFGMVLDNVPIEVDSVALPSLPFWTQASRVHGVFYFKYGASLGALTQLCRYPATDTEATPINPRKLGLAAANGATFPLSEILVDDVQVKYGRQENNVEIIEHTLATVPAGDPEEKFHAFVHRDPDDAGTYQLDKAQRELDRAKQAHTYMRIGESDCFRCDDPYSLTDRDVLGS